MKDVLNLFELMLGYYRSDPSADFQEQGPVVLSVGDLERSHFVCLFSRVE